jgi:malate/lactate dehydrogenase
MVPLWSATTIGGIQIENLPAFSGLPKEEMISTVKSSGEEIIRKMGADYLAYSLLDSIVDNYFIILEKLGEKIEGEIINIS